MPGNKYICKNCDKELKIEKGDNIDDDKYIIFVYPCSCVAPWMEDNNLVKREYKYKITDMDGDVYYKFTHPEQLIKKYIDNFIPYLKHQPVLIYEIEKKIIFKKPGIIDRVIKTKREITIEKNTGGEWGYFYKN